MNKHSIIACICNDYTVELDGGRKAKGKGERLVGCFGTTGGGDSDYFKGIIFTPNKDGYSMDGNVSLSKKEFDGRVKIFHEVF